MRYVIAVAASLVFASGLSAAQAETGISSNVIAIGQSAEPQGPASALGLGMRGGLLAAFGEASRMAGGHGRPIEWISVDDGYEPSKSIAATRELIEHEKVFALTGPVGTPIAVAAPPTAAAAEVPFIAAVRARYFPAVRNSTSSLIAVRAATPKPAVPRHGRSDNDQPDRSFKAIDR